MTHLIFILVSLGLLVGFFFLTQYEAAKGIRFFASVRSKIDEEARRAEFIIDNVDLPAFLRTEILRIAHRVSHDVAHFSLKAVRATERLLTQLVRHLRSKHMMAGTPSESGQAREFVKTLSDFKDNLKATHPEISEIK